MKRVKISLYLEPIQVRMIDNISRQLGQRRALILREAVNCYLALYSKSQKGRRK